MATFTNNTILRWSEESKITCVTWCHGLLFVGDDLGKVYSFKSSLLNNLVESDSYNVTTVCKKKIVSITSFEPRQELLVLDSEGNLYVLDIFFKKNATVLCRKVMCFSKQAVESYEECRALERILPITYMANICVGMKDKIQIYSAIGEKIVHQRDISMNDLPVTICWLNNAIVYGSNKSYVMMNSEGTVSVELCRNVNEDDKTLSVEFKNPTIMAATCVDKDVMVICQDIGVFYNTETMNLSQKNTIQWSGKLEALGSCPPFIVGFTIQKKVEIYGIRDQVLYKRIDQSSTKHIYHMQDKCCFLTATSNAVSLVQPCGYYDHIGNILQENKITEALSLVNLHFSPSDPRRLTEIRICHTVAGWLKFSSLNYPCAFQHFSFGVVDIAYLLSFWDHYYPIELPQNYEPNAALPSALLHLIPKRRNIREFIRVASTEKGNDGTSSSGKNLLEIANRSFATFILKMLKTLKFDQNDDEFHKKLPCILETVALLLLAECDDTRYNNVLSKDIQSSFIDVDIAKQHLIDMDKSDVYAKLLIRDGRLIEAMDIYADLITTKSLNRTDVNLPALELASCINALLEKGGSSTTTSRTEIKDIMLKFLPLLLEALPSAALQVLTKNHIILPITSDEILAMMSEYRKSVDGGVLKNELEVKYLEDLVIVNKAGSVHENTLLAQCYIERLMSKEASINSKNQKSDKSPLFSLLEGSYTFDIKRLESLIKDFDIIEVKVILNAKKENHYEALELIYNGWGGDCIKLCEAYCLCFGDVHNYGQLKDDPYKKLFTCLDHWMSKVNEYPFVDSNLYKLDSNSKTSIDNILISVLKIIIKNSSDVEKCMDSVKYLLCKYIRFCGYKSALSGLNILELIPDEWSFANFANFFTHLQLNSLHEHRTELIKKGLTRTLHSQTSLTLSKLTSMPPIKVDANTNCSICSEPIKIGMPIGMPPPYLLEHSKLPIHEHCAKNVRIR